MAEDHLQAGGKVTLDEIMGVLASGPGGLLDCMTLEQLPENTDWDYVWNMARRRWLMVCVHWTGPALGESVDSMTIRYLLWKIPEYNIPLMSDWIDAHAVPRAVYDAIHQYATLFPSEADAYKIGIMLYNLCSGLTPEQYTLSMAATSPDDTSILAGNILQGAIADALPDVPSPYEDAKEAAVETAKEAAKAAGMGVGVVVAALVLSSD